MEPSVTLNLCMQVKTSYLDEFIDVEYVAEVAGEMELHLWCHRGSEGARAAWRPVPSVHADRGEQRKVGALARIEQQERRHEQRIFGPEQLSA